MNEIFAAIGKCVVLGVTFGLALNLLLYCKYVSVVDRLMKIRGNEK